MQLKLLGVIVAILFLCGCFPMRSEFYEPESKKGVIELAHCRGLVGVPNTVRFKKKYGIESYVTTYFESEQEDILKIGISLKIPKGVIVEIKTDAISINVKGSETPIKYTKIWAGNYGFTADEIKDVIGSTVFSGDEYEIYEFLVFIPNPVDEFTVTMPVFYVNDHPVNFGKIKLTNKTEWAIYPLNC